MISINDKYLKSIEKLAEGYEYEEVQTLIACEELNRQCYMMEYDPKYVDVIIKRWETLTGRKVEKLN